MIRRYTYSKPSNPAGRIQLPFNSAIRIFKEENRSRFIDKVSTMLRTTLLFFLKFSFIIILFSCSQSEGNYHVQTAEIPEGYTLEQKIELSARVLPHPRQMKWFEDEFFGFIHFGPNTFSGREWGTGLEEPELFNPTDLDTGQWCSLMNEAEMKRVVMVAKHHEGFALWPSRYTDHSVASSPWKDGDGDVIRELVDSCREYGIRIGIYLSPADLFQIESLDGYYGNDSEFTDRTIPRPVDGRPFEDERTFTYNVDDYNEYFLNQLFELLTEYGPIHEVWFDGANPRPGTGQTYNYDAWYDMIRQLAPDAVIFGKGPDVRWCGNEGGRTREAEYNVIPLDTDPDHYDWPDKMDDNIAGRDRINEETRFFHYYPAETNTSIRHGWFWRNDDEQQVRSTEDVFDIYERSVGGNSVFHLNIPPNDEGKFSQRDADILRETGRLIREVYGNNLFDGASSTAGEVFDGNGDSFWEAPGKQAEVDISLPETRRINRLMIQEAIAHRGERVEEHHLEAWIDGEWTEVAAGKTIGYKRILRFPAVETDRFRLKITQSRLNPAISHISAHFYDEPPKPVVIRRNDEGEVTLGVGTSFSWNDHGTADQSQPVYYTLDGSTPTEESIRFDGPFALPEGGQMTARAITEGREGPVSEARFGIISSGWTASVTGTQSDTEQEIQLTRPWTCCEEEPSPSYTITIDMTQSQTISGFMYTPVPGQNGYIESYQADISTDGQTWETIHTGSFGNIRNDPSVRTVLFDSQTEGRYLRLTELTPPGGEEKVGAGRIEMLP
ncbi:MAG: alpha-L-fucosidase [Balneolaceae bacterium]|nr:alpha-L-fucosidase [Balneolaceae bacterium]